MDHILQCHEIYKTDFVRGQGCYLYDSQGGKYIDFEAGVWCASLGYNHPRINRVIQDRLDLISHINFRYPGQITEETAVDLLNVVSWPDGKCTFLSSGSEAVEFGIQAARMITGRSHLLTMSDAYLGAFGLAAKKQPDPWVMFDWSGCLQCRDQEKCGPGCPSFDSVPLDDIAGFIFEPGSSSGLVKFPPEYLIQNLAKAVQEHGGLVVVDEVTTGLGRTGLWFGYQHYDLRPDIIAAGKGLGNGFPISAVVVTREVAGELENRSFRYVQSHQNDPLACAVAREVLAVIQEEDLIDRGAALGRRFLDKLSSLKDRKQVLDIRGRGLMLGVELASENGKYPGPDIYLELLDRGFLVGCSPLGNMIRIYPALTIEERDLDCLVENLEQVLV